MLALSQGQMQGITGAQGQMKAALQPLPSLQKVGAAGLDQGQSLLAETFELVANCLALLGCELAAPHAGGDPSSNLQQHSMADPESLVALVDQPSLTVGVANASEQQREQHVTIAIGHHLRLLSQLTHQLNGAELRPGVIRMQPP